MPQNEKRIKVEVLEAPFSVGGVEIVRGSERNSVEAGRSANPKE